MFITSADDLTCADVRTKSRPQNVCRWSQTGLYREPKVLEKRALHRTVGHIDNYVHVVRANIVLMPPPQLHVLHERLSLRLHLGVQF